MAAVCERMRVRDCVCVRTSACVRVCVVVCAHVYAPVLMFVRQQPPQVPRCEEVRGRASEAHVKHLIVDFAAGGDGSVEIVAHQFLGSVSAQHTHIHTHHKPRTVYH